MKPPQKKEENNDPITYSQDDDYNFGYNEGLQDERDYRDWLIDNAPIEDLIPNPNNDDTLVFDTVKAIRKMLKGEK